MTNAMTADTVKQAEDVTQVWQARNMVEEEIRRVIRRIEILTDKIDNYEGNEQNHRREKARLVFQLPFVTTHLAEFNDHQPTCFDTNSFCVDCKVRAKRLLGDSK